MDSEFDIIRKFFKPLSSSHALGLSDDTANVPEGRYVCSKDVLVGGIHFFEEDPAILIAQKVLRTNISDVLAKGAKPAYYMLGCVFAQNASVSWIENFCKGLKADQVKYDLELLGGDTTRQKGAGSSVFSVTIWGSLAEGQNPVLRSGASSGDVVFVSGDIGDSGLGLQSKRNQIEIDQTSLDYLERKYLLPSVLDNIHPLVQRFATASLDVSDGLVADARHLSIASGQNISLTLEDIPVSDAARNWLNSTGDILNARRQLVVSGDDYQVLFTVKKEQVQAMKEMASSENIKVTAIGQCIGAGSELVVLDRQGGRVQFEIFGYDHFR